MNRRKEPAWRQFVEDWLAQRNDWGLTYPITNKVGTSTWAGPVVYAASTPLAKLHGDFVTMRYPKRSHVASALSKYIPRSSWRVLIVADPLCENHDLNVRQFQGRATYYAREIVTARRLWKYRERYITDTEADLRFYCDRFGLVMPTWVVMPKVHREMVTKLVSLELEGKK